MTTRIGRGICVVALTFAVIQESRPAGGCPPRRGDSSSSRPSSADDAVGETAQPRAAARIGAADPIVAHLHDGMAVGAHARCTEACDRVGVLDDVGERLGDHEVGRRLDRRGQPVRRGISDSSIGIGRRPASASRAPCESAVGQHGRVDAARELAQLLERELQLLLRADHQALGGVGVLAHAALRQAQRQRHRDEPLLGAVVQVALQAAALGDAGLDEPLARGAQLLHARAQLGGQLLVLHGQRGRGGDRGARARAPRTSTRS